MNRVRLSPNDQAYLKSIKRRASIEREETAIFVEVERLRLMTQALDERRYELSAELSQVNELICAYHNGGDLVLWKLQNGGAQ